MSLDRTTLHQVLARELPDLPRWVELRALLLWNECEVFGLQQAPELSFALRSQAGELVVAVGRPEAGAVQAAVAGGGPGMEVIAPWAQSAYLTPVLPGWPSTRARLHLLGEAPRLPDTKNTSVSFLEPDSPAWHLVPEDYLEELTAAARHSPIAAVFVSGKPVSFCYAGAITESLWDISIDTLPGYRRRGYAALSVSYMVEHMHARGKQPVWGAVEENPASWKLAEKLGFVQVDELVLFTRPD